MVYFMILWYAIMFFVGGAVTESFKEVPDYASCVYPSVCYGIGMLVWKWCGVKE